MRDTSKKVKRTKEAKRSLKMTTQTETNAKESSFTEEFFEATSPKGKGKQDKTNDQTKECKIETVHKKEENDDECDFSSDDDSISDEIEDSKKPTEAHTKVTISALSSRLKATNTALEEAKSVQRRFKAIGPESAKAQTQREMTKRLHNKRKRCKEVLEHAKLVDEENNELMKGIGKQMNKHLTNQNSPSCQ